MMPLTPTSTIIFNAVCVATGTLFVAFRLFTVKSTRRRPGQRRSPGRSFSAIASDVCIMGAWVFLALGATCGFWKAARQLQRMNGSDDKVLDGMGFEKGDLSFGMKLIIAETLSFIISLWLVKGAMVAMIFDIRQYLSKGLRRLLYFTTFFTISALASILLSSFLTCRPFTRNWKVGDDFCSAVNSSTLIALAAITILNDILIFSIPMFLVRGIKLPFSRIFAIGFALLLLGASTAATLLRTIVSSQLDPPPHSGPHGPEGPVRHMMAYSIDPMAKIELCSVLQLTLNIIIACAPQLRVFFGGDANDSRREIFGLLPKSVGNLVIMKTVEVNVSMVDRESMRGLRNASDSEKNGRSEVWL